MRVSTHFRPSILPSLFRCLPPASCYPLVSPLPPSPSCAHCSARKESRQQAEALYKEGKYKQARERYTRAVNITPAIAHDLIRVRE